MLSKETIDKMNEVQKSEYAFAIHQIVIGNEQKRRELFIENVDLISNEIKEFGLFKFIVGDEKAKFVAYLSQLEVYYSRTEINRWVKIMDTLCKNFGMRFEDLIAVPSTRLEAISKFAKDKTHAKELLSFAQTMLPRDWSDEIKKLQGKPTTDDGHEHQFVDYKICEVCGMKTENHNHASGGI